MGISAVLGVASAVVGGVSALEQGAAQQNMLNYQAEVANNNAIIANQNAEHAIQAGQEQAAAKSRQVAAQVGAIKTAQAANNVDVNTGSAADVQASQRETGKLDTETILNNADLTAYGYRANAANFKAQAGLDQTAGSQAMIGGILKGTGSVIGSAQSLPLKWTTPEATASVGEPLSLAPPAA